MNLVESLKKDEEELASLLEAEGKPEEVKEDIKEEEQPEVVETPAKEEEKPKEEQPEVEKPKSQQEWAKARYDAKQAKFQAEAAAAQRIAQLEAELEAVKNPPKPIPTKEENWEGHTEAKIETVEQRLARLESERAEETRQNNIRRQIEDAKREFNENEDVYIKHVPDYENARKVLVNSIAFGVKVTNPDATPYQIAQAVEHQLLLRGQRAVVQGINPAHAIYEEAMQLGYSKETKEEKKKPTIDTIAKNKSRSANMAGSGGGESSERTAADVIGMSNKKLRTLTDADWKRLEMGEAV